MTDFDIALILILVLVITSSVFVVWLNRPVKNKEFPKTK